MTSKTRSILLAAVLATPVAFIASPAHAQYRVNNGQALDANNQIGGGGINGGHDLGINSGDRIVTGNVTAGREFRGNVSSTDSRAFRGNLAGGLSDRFIRQSASATDNNAQNVRQFYGVSQGTAPPPGFMQVAPGSQAYIPAPTPTREGSDVRMGDIFKSDNVAFTAPTFGEVMMPGPIDNSNSQSLLRASPLYGVVQDNQQQLTDPTKPGMQNLRRRSNVPGLDDKQVQSARDELRGPAGTDNTDTNSNDPNAKNEKKGNDLNLGTKAQIGAPAETPPSSALPGQPLDSTLTGQPLGGQIKSEGTQRNELVPPVEQSTQYAELHNRFANKQAGPMTDQQANNLYNQQKSLRDKEMAQKKGATPGGNNSTTNRPSGGSGRVTFPGGSSGITGGGTTPPAAKTDQPTDTNQTPAPDVKPVEPTQKEPSASKQPANPEAPTLNAAGFHPGEPVKVSSLTDGMKPGRVKDLLGAAEDQMRQGKYTAAIDQYDLAERIVPNNPMITMGRANAELGASYYARAEANIRRGLVADDNTMMGAQFDLNKFLGKDRVAFLEKDLKEITTTEPKQARAPFLLAYLKYHTGDKKMASNYLALSEQRLGKEDPLYKQLRVTWDLPKAEPLPDATDANK